ncbi:hypothetical protein BO94DRAFT_584306 [Aspergillus sclerotioniger CBS 115572]|uniref:Uncharacterized protein n=1 Tax=Aspergillus sclerotioniger CBS 115572 TaxID=1450535 RepID=A0A317WVB2_9EURO|nr:hypothetical protein BO94DRAFT_584306 [Aspergillus sclerotioniger CBS 115572]PWY90293.1 hypothetical protein BO94DRAFT_584306 [Aspergillus sclerotioniger CBS 115572]
MKLLSTIVASALALAVSVQANDCTAGMSYCAGVLDDVDGAKYNPMMWAQINAKYGKDWNYYIYSPSDFVWHCGAGGTITMGDRCGWGCVNAGAGNSDYCRWE